MFWASLSVCPSVCLSVPLMGTTFRYIFLEEERCPRCRKVDVRDSRAKRALVRRRTDASREAS